MTNGVLRAVAHLAPESRGRAERPARARRGASGRRSIRTRPGVVIEAELAGEARGEGPRDAVVGENGGRSPAPRRPSRRRRLPPSRPPSPRPSARPARAPPAAGRGPPGTWPRTPPGAGASGPPARRGSSRPRRRRRRPRRTAWSGPRPCSETSASIRARAKGPALPGPAGLGPRRSGAAWAGRPRGGRRASTACPSAPGCGSGCRRARGRPSCVREVGRARDPVGLRDHAGVGVGARRGPDGVADRLRLLGGQRPVEEQPAMAVAGRGLDDERGVDLDVAGLALVGVGVDHEGEHAAGVGEAAAPLRALRDGAGLDVDVVARRGVGEGRLRPSGRRRRSRSATRPPCRRRGGCGRAGGGRVARRRPERARPGRG